MGLLAAAAIAPGTGMARGPIAADDAAGPIAPLCGDGRAIDVNGNPCPQPRPIHAVVGEAKWNAASVYDRFLKGEATPEEVKAADYTLSKLSRERIGAHDWSIPDNTPAGLRLRGITPPHDYGPLLSKFYPFEQINWWYCGPATAQSILWYLGPHRSESHDEVWGGRPWLTGNPYEDQWLLANNFWLATNKYEGTNWGEAYMPHTLNAWRGTFWYQQSATPMLGGTLTKEQALMALRYDFDRSYPVAENVLYAPHTYYPYGFWPGVIYQHWDVLHGYVEDIATGDGYVKVGQVYHDERIPYERFQQVAWDVHWSAIGNWYGIVW
ncbi:MAG: hypothetical protein ACRDHF_09305 [Tepidiformaceae bacterium]